MLTLDRIRKVNDQMYAALKRGDRKEAVDLWYQGFNENLWTLYKAPPLIVKEFIDPSSFNPQVRDLLNKAQLHLEPIVQEVAKNLQIKPHPFQNRINAGFQDKNLWKDAYIHKNSTIFRALLRESILNSSGPISGSYHQ